mmetsp:Transcript_16974/g.60334  ORF Transcript_16974/g.60334 Transcript_16974/m.60334 type:complete len:239 (+) Transcript_16974:293-1009(+)
MRMLPSSSGRMWQMPFGSLLARASQGATKCSRNFKLSWASTELSRIFLTSASNRARYDDLDASKTATTRRTSGCCSWSEMPLKSTVRDRQNWISSKGPETLAWYALSCELTTSLICRVQWITMDSSCCARSLFFAATAGASSPMTLGEGRYKTVLPRSMFAASVIEAMKRWKWPVKSLRTLSGQGVCASKICGAKTPFICLRRDCIEAPPDSDPCCTLASMVTAVSFSCRDVESEFTK